MDTALVKVISAQYGPSHGRKLHDSDLNYDENAKIAYTRDVTHIIRALLWIKINDQYINQDNYFIDVSQTAYPRISSSGEISIHPSVQTITLLEETEFNSIFGDPCLGTTKKLTIQYAFIDKANQQRKDRVFSFTRVSFAEHERVILTKSNLNHESSSKSSQSSFDNNTEVHNTTWSLPSYISEIVIPIVLPFLDFNQRIHAQLVCKTWLNIIRSWGVVKVIDVKDPCIPTVTTDFLRGVMNQSFASLHSLFLPDLHQLTIDDLSTAIPHLRQLRTVDISRCHKLGDSTLELFSNHLQETLEVIYIKDLPLVTDKGLISLCESCTNIRVLEISHLKISDESGIAIGNNLTQLEALYTRNNFRLTNESIDLIMEKCTKLKMCTLWGCNRLNTLYPVGDIDKWQSNDNLQLCTLGCEKLVLLNLWGCHGLSDSVSTCMKGFHHLKTLILSECHNLSDAFLLELCRSIPQIQHLHLRYLMKITDFSIGTIANFMVQLRTLDLSFCTSIPLSSILYLLETRCDTLTELRLFNCYQIDVSVPKDTTQHISSQGGDGTSFVDVIQSTSESSVLSILDVRNCYGDHEDQSLRKEDENFSNGMKSLDFERKSQGLFIRSAKWNLKIHERLIRELVDSNSGL